MEFTTDVSMIPSAFVKARVSYKTPSFSFSVYGQFAIGVCYPERPMKFDGDITLSPEGGGIAPATFNVSLMVGCPNAQGETTYHAVVQIRDWEIVPGVIGIPEGNATVTLVRSGESGDFKSWKVHIVATIALLGASTGKMPDFGNGLIIYLDLMFDKSGDDFKLKLKVLFQIDVLNTADSKMKIDGQGEIAYPCELGDRIGAEVGLMIHIGDLKIDRLAGSLYFYCEVMGLEDPAIMGRLWTEGTVQFVKGFTLEDFEISVNLYDNKTSLTAESDWIFAGSVSAKIAISSGGDMKHGAAIHFAFDSRDNSWEIMASYNMVSPTFNLSLAMGHSTECRPSGTFINGDFSIGMAGGVLKGFANGAAHCGERRITKGAIAVEMGISEANLYFPGVSIFIRNATVAIAGFPPPSALQYPWEESVKSYADPAYKHMSALQSSGLGAVETEQFATNWLPERSKPEFYVGTIANFYDALKSKNDGVLFDCSKSNGLLSNIAFMFDEAGCSTAQICQPKMRVGYTCSAQDTSPAAKPYGKCVQRYTDVNAMFKAPRDKWDDKGWQVLYENELICPAGYGLRNSTMSRKSDGVHGQFMFYCCEYPEQVKGGDDEKKYSECFQTSRASDAEGTVAMAHAINDKIFMKSSKGLNPNEVPRASIPTCAPGEIMRGFALQTCQYAHKEKEFQQRSRWQVNCGKVLQPSPPPPNAPPPAPEWELDLASMDWKGSVDATIYLYFGDDMDDDFAESTLGNIEGDFDFHTEGDDFVVDNVKFSAAVRYEQPAEEGSWQAAAGKSEMVITGKVKINYPCPAPPGNSSTAGLQEKIPLFYGSVEADFAIGSEDAPILVEGASAIIRYDCVGGNSLSVNLELDLLSIGEEFELRAVKLDFTMQENKTSASGWNFFGAFSGRMSFGKSDREDGGHDHEGVIFFMYNSVVPFLDVAYSHTYRPNDDLMLNIRLRYTQGVCTDQGIFIQVSIDMKGDDFKLRGTGQGAKHCKNPTDDLGVRYNFSLSVEELVLAGGAFSLTNVLIEGIGRGPYQDESTWDLGSLRWGLTVAATINVNIEADASMNLQVIIKGKFLFGMDAPPEGYNETEIVDGESPVSDGSPGSSFALVRAEVDAFVNISIGGVMELTIDGRFRWPCRSYMDLNGNLELKLPDISGELAMSMVINCPTAGMYLENGVVLIYKIQIQIKAALSNPYDQKVQKKFCKPIEDYPDGLFSVAHSEYFADEEIKKAQEVLATLVTNGEDYAGCEVVKLKVTADPNKGPARVAWQFQAYTVQPIEFAGGQFSISNIMLRVTAYDNPNDPTPALGKKDVFPSFDAKHHDLRGSLTAMANVEIEALGAETAALIASSAASNAAARASLGGGDTSVDFKLSAALDFKFEKDADEEDMRIAWNLTAMVFLGVRSETFELNLTANYSRPCQKVGAGIYGVINVDMPGAVEMDAVISGTIYCQGASPRIHVYTTVQSMLIADMLELQDVLFSARGFEVGGPPAADADEMSMGDMEWKIEINGTLNFDKIFGMIPNMASTDTEVAVFANISINADGEVTLHKITIEFRFDLKIFNGPDPIIAMKGEVWGSYPCVTGETIGAKVNVALMLEGVNAPDISTEIYYYCGKRLAHEPIFTFDAVCNEPITIGEEIEIKKAQIGVQAYNDRSGKLWVAGQIVAAVDIDVGEAGLMIDFGLSFKTKERDIRVAGKVNVTYVTDAMELMVTGDFAISENCTEFDVAGRLRLLGDLPLLAEIGGNMGCPYLDETGGKITNMTFLAIVREMQLTPDLSLEDVGVAMSLAMRSGGVGDGDMKFEINITGTVRFDNAASSGGGAKVGAHVSIFTTLGKYDWCAECPFVLGKFAMEAGVNVSTPEFALLGAVKYTYPCVKGDISGGMANMDVTAGDLVIRNFTVMVQYFCESGDSMELPAWTLEAYTTSPIQITKDVTIEHLKIRVSLYEFEGETYAAGMLEGHVEAGSAGAAALGVTAGERVLPRDGGWRDPAIHGDWGVHNHWVFHDKPRARHLMHPDDVALGLSSAPRKTSSDPAVVAEMGGVKVKAKFIFDTRTNPPLFGAQVEAHFTAGCVNISIGVLADTACDASRPMQLTGKFVFDCGKVQGEGSISGSKWCDDGGDHPLYRMRVEIPTLSFGDIALRDVLLEALFVYPAKKKDTNTSGDSPAPAPAPAVVSLGGAAAAAETKELDLDWNFTATATLDIGAAGSGMPSMPKEGFEMSITAGVERDVADNWSVELFGTFSYSAPSDGDTPPSVIVEGAFNFVYPCDAGESIGAIAKMQVNAGKIAIKGIKVEMRMYCAPLPGFPTFLVNATLAELKIETFTLKDLEISVEGYENADVDQDTGEKLGMWFIGTFKGKLDIEAGDMKVGASIYFVFDSLKGTILIAIEVNVGAGAVQMSIAMQVGTGDACDAIKGNYVRGTVKVELSETSILEGTIRGTAHCDTHPDAMKRLGRLPRETVGKFNEMHDELVRQANVVAYGVQNVPGMNESAAAEVSGATKGLDAKLGRMSHVRLGKEEDAPLLYPQYEMMIDIAEFEITDGLVLEGASMHMWSTDAEYNEDIGAAKWAWEVYGAASYSTAGEDAPAADGLSMRVAVAATGAPGVDVAIIVNASLAMKFGDMSLSGWGAFAIPCAGAGMVARLELGLGPAMPGIGGQKATADAVMFCKPNATVLKSGDDYDVAFFRADLAGLVSSDSLTFSKLAVEAFIFSSDGEQHVRGSVVGEVDSLSACPGLSFGASIFINTKENLVILDVKVAYDSPMVKLAVRARVPLSGCDRTGWRLTGDMSIDLGDAGSMALEVNGTKLCHPEATKEFGYTWRVAFALMEFELNLGGAKLSLTDVAGDFKGRSIGDALTKTGGESELVWSGTFSATLNLNIAAARLGGPGAQRAALGGGGGMVPGGLSSPGFTLTASVALKLADSKVVKGVFSVGISMNTDALEMSADMTYYWPKGTSDVQIEGKGMFRLKGLGAGTEAAEAARLGAGGLTIPPLFANFSIMYEPGPDGCDMTVFAGSGGEKLKVGDLDLGEFEISAFRYQAHGELPEGWKGTIASSGGVVEAGVAFDTRTGAFSVEARVKIDLGPVELDVFGKYENTGCTQLGGELRIKKFPEFKFSAMYDKYCPENPKNGELAWAVNATAERFTFVEGITLEFAKISAYSLYSDGKEGPTMVIIHAKLAMGGSMPGAESVAAGGSGSTGSKKSTSNSTTNSTRNSGGADEDVTAGGPALTIYAEISEAGTVVSVTGEFALYFGEGGVVASEKEAQVVLAGQIDFTYPCPPGGEITASLSLQINMPDIIVDGATASAIWYCLTPDEEKGIYPKDCDSGGEEEVDEKSGIAEKVASSCGKTAAYAADVKLIQVGSFAVKDLHIALTTYGKKGAAKEYLIGVIRGTVEIGPLTITAAVQLDTRPGAKTIIDVALDVDISPGIRVSGGGRFAMPCTQMGDMRLNASVVFSDVGMAWLDGMEAVGTYESDCADQFKVEVTIDFSGKDSNETKEISDGVQMSFGAKVVLLVKTMPLTKQEIVDQKKPDMLLQVSFQLGDKVDVALGVLMSEEETTVSLGIHIQETTMEDMFKQMDKVIPGSNVADETEGDEEEPELGKSRKFSQNKKGRHPTAHAAARHALSAQLGGGDEDGDAGDLGGEIDVMKIPETHVLFEFSSKGSMSIFIAVHDVKVFNLGLDVVLVVTCEEGEWNAFAYLGFTDIKDGWLDFPQPWTWLSALANIPIAFLTGGSALKNFGIKFATEQMTFSPAMVKYMPVPIPSTEEGVDFLLHMDLDIGGSPITKIYMGVIKMIAGECESPLSQLICDDLEKPGGREFFQSEQPMIPTQIEVGHTFTSAEGVPVTHESSETQFRWMSLKLVIGIGFIPPTFMAEVEVKAEIDFPPSSPNGPPVRAEAKVRIRVMITVTYLEFEASLMMKLKTKAQIWANPFGDLPHMGIVFPLALGFGVRIYYFAPPMITYFEFEAGIMGCSNPMYYKGQKLADIVPEEDDDDGTSALLGGDRYGTAGDQEIERDSEGVALPPRRPRMPDSQNKYQWNQDVLSQVADDGESAEAAASAIEEADLGFFGGGGGDDGTDESVKKFGYGLTIPGLKDYTCGADDPYGDEPTVIKLAIYIRLTASFGETPAVAFMLVIRQFYIARLIFMTLSSPPGAGLMMMRPILDMFSAKKLDVSLNTNPFPVKMYSGTVIQAGILVDIEYLKLFGIMMFRKAYFHFCPDPFKLEVHLFIEPFDFGELIAVTGITGEPKYKSMIKAAKALKDAAIAEKKAARKAKKARQKAEQEFRARQAEKMRKAAEALATANAKIWDTPCMKENCYTCGRAAEGVADLVLSCGESLTVIDNVTFAVWGVDAEQPPWQFTDEPDMCTNATPPTGRMRRVAPAGTAEVLESLCKNKEKCVVKPSRKVFGLPKGFDAKTNPSSGLAISAVVECREISEAEKVQAERLEASLEMRCTDGCLSCTSEDRHDKEKLVLSCHSDAIITDIVDAVYGDGGDAPPWAFTETVGTCQSPTRKVPTGEMCKQDNARTVMQLRRACLGRQQCVLTWKQIDEILPVNPCPGAPLRMSVITECRKSQLPLGIDEQANAGEFRFLHYEERTLLGSASGALVDVFQMRTAFERSPDIIMSSLKIKNFTEYVWGARAGEDSDKVDTTVRRMIFTFTLDETEGSEDGEGVLNLWKWRVIGHSSFWRQGGMLAIVNKATNKDVCAIYGGCDLSKCVDKVKSESGGEEGCVFNLNLQAGGAYIGFVYGASDVVIEDAVLSVQWKPPASCFLRKQCDNAAAPYLCKNVTQAEMDWHHVKRGEFPPLLCTGGGIVDISVIEVETKPFCIDGSLYDNVADCWPLQAGVKNALEGAGCAGEYHVEDAVTEGLMLGGYGDIHETKQTNKKHMDVEIDDDGRCFLTNKKTQSAITEGRVVRLDFEEGPCRDGVEDSAAPALDRADPKHAYWCQARTYPGADAQVTNATLYEFPVEIENAMSDEKVVETGHLKLSAKGQHYAYPGHTGFALDLERYTGKAQVVVVDLNDESNTGSLDAKSFTLTMWLKKPDYFISEWGDAMAGTPHSQTPQS